MLAGVGFEFGIRAAILAARRAAADGAFEHHDCTSPSWSSIEALYQVAEVELCGVPQQGAYLFVVCPQRQCHAVSLLMQACAVSRLLCLWPQLANSSWMPVAADHEFGARTITPYVFIFFFSSPVVSGLLTI